METKEKTFQFSLLAKTVKPIVDKKVEGGDLTGALSLLRTSLEKDFSLETIKDIALTYSEMEQYELSNKYWHKYLSLAPKNMCGIAYEELLMNHFCLENRSATVHYFMQKIELDGFVSDAVLDSGIKEALEEPKKPTFRLLKPVEKADFSYELSEARREFSRGRYEKTIELLTQIPKGCPQYIDSLEDLSLAYYLQGDAEKGISIQRELIKEKGENVISFCHLSGMYKTLKNEDKSLYYYNRAKEMQSTDPEDVYRLAFIAFEREDGAFAIECMEKIILERAYDVNMLYFYGLALINCNRYEDAEKVLKKAYRINPDERSLAFYIRLCDSLKKGETEYKKHLPLRYYLDCPESVYAERIKRLSAFDSKDKKAISNFVKSPKNKELLEWGLNSKNQSLNEAVAYGLMRAETLIGDKMLIECLMRSDISDHLKRTIIYYLVCKGRKTKINTVMGNIFFSFKPRPVSFEQDEMGEKFLVSYAMCVSTYALLRVDGGDRLSKQTMAIYTLLKDKKEMADFAPEEISALITYKCNLAPLESVKSIALVYNTEEEKINQIIKLYKECSYD